MHRVGYAPLAPSLYLDSDSLYRVNTYRCITEINNFQGLPQESIRDLSNKSEMFNNLS